MTNRRTLRHGLLTCRILLETALLLLVFSVLAVVLTARLAAQPWCYLAYVPVLFAQALLFQRLYIIGHEGAHRKLLLNSRLGNDLLGQLLLLPLLIPIEVYRKVHRFHHGFNRRDIHTSALDVYVSRRKVTPLISLYYHTLWYLGVFAGGYYLHSLVSVVLFLFVPTHLAERISPAFKGWNGWARARAWTQLLLGIALHAAVWILLGQQVWLAVLGWPMLAFAWVWSLLVYVFHYATTIGPTTRYNVRALDRNALFSWLFLHFNEHATHHMYPNLPWYELTAQRQPLPPEFAEKNQGSGSVLRAIFAQLRGPTIVYQESKHEEAAHAIPKSK